MSDKINFILILHNHQPVGNFDWIFRNATVDAYGPFLDAFERHPRIKAALHTTGPLLEWLSENMPEYLNRLARLVSDGRVEIIGGAFYEPILSMLPDRDKIGQITMMNRWIENRFGTPPRGFWVAERIWEPYFPSIFGSCGYSYTILDNTHFQYAGLPDARIWGSYTTEDQGISVRVLPIDYNLRYLIPFREPQETIDYLGSMKDRGVNAVTYADDGEKFGVWPGTKKWVYEEGWLDRFFSALEENSHWIDTTLPSHYTEQNPSLGAIYLPTASYKEMTEWALPVETQKVLNSAEHSVENDERFNALKPFIRGGFWRNFLSKYPESNAMYRRTLIVSSAVENLKHKSSYNDAVRELYQAQCNCGYWHGVFGGLYLNFLRRAIYEHLIKAESLISDGRDHVEVCDSDGNDSDEIILRNGMFVLIIDPKQGGIALECDYIPKAFNIFDTMTRREEAYHQNIPDSSNEDESDHSSIHDKVRSKEKNIRTFLHYDWYRRLNFIDHFISASESLDAFSSSNYNELGDCINAPYTVTKTTERPQPGLVLERSSRVNTPQGSIPITVRKNINLTGKTSSFSTEYSLAWADSCEDILFGVEMNLGLQSGNDECCFITIPDRVLAESHFASKGIEDSVSEISFTIGWMPLVVKVLFSRPTLLWRFPIETISLSEGGVERNYQNTCLLPLWKLDSQAGVFDVTITFEVE